MKMDLFDSAIGLIFPNGRVSRKCFRDSWLNLFHLSWRNEDVSELQTTLSMV